MATSKRTSPPKIVEDLNVTAVTEQKAENRAPESHPELPASSPKKTSRSSKASSESPSAAATKSKKSLDSTAPKADESKPVPAKQEGPKKTVNSATEKPAAESKPSKTPATKTGTVKSESPPTPAELEKLKQPEIHQMIEEAAYYVAQRRNEPGHDEENWAEATAEILAKIRSGVIS